MAPYTSGSGGSVSGVSYSDPEGAASLERYVYGILGLLEQEENNLTKSSPDRTDRISISANLSTKTAAIDLLLNVVAAIGVGGIITYTATHYLTGSTFTSGTGGNSSAPNLAQAAMEGVVALKLLELDPNKKLNPDNKAVITRCTHTIAASGGTNTTFSALLDFPIEVISLPGGGNVIEGKVFLK